MKTEITTSNRKLYNIGGGPASRRHLLALIPLVAMLVIYFVLPASADTQHTYYLAGARVNGTFDQRAAASFAYQPVRVLRGSFPNGAGREHFDYYAGLLQFVDGAGNATGQGFCIDLKAPRQSGVPYTNGPRLDQAGGVANINQILWILNNVWPAGPSQLGNDGLGLAREGAAVQAAIWAYSDNMVLDGPGSRGYDAGIAAEMQRIVDAARNAGPMRTGSFALSTSAPSYALNDLPADRPVDVTARVIGGDGNPVPDGTEVDFSTSAGLVGGQPATAASPARAHTSSGNATVRVSVPNAVPGQQVGVSASAVIPIKPGRVLNPASPNQRLIEFSWNNESVEGSTSFTFTARPVPHVAKIVKDLTPGHEATGVDREIVAHTGDHLRYEISCGNSGLVPTAGGVVTDDLAAAANTSLGLLQNIKAFQVVNGKETPAVVTGSLLTWNVGAIPAGGTCVVGFEGDVPKALDSAATTITNCAYLNAAGGTTGGIESNCVHTVIKTTASLVAVKLVDGTKANAAAPGSTVVYTIEATNTGNRNLANVVVNDDLGVGTLAELTEVKPAAGGHFDAAKRVVSWTIPSLPAGASHRVSFSAKVPDASVVKCGTSVAFNNVAEVHQAEIPGGEVPTGAVQTVVAGQKCAPPPPPPAAQVPPAPAPPVTEVKAAASVSMPITGSDVRKNLIVGAGLALAGLLLLVPSRRELQG